MDIATIGCQSTSSKRACSKIWTSRTRSTPARSRSRWTSTARSRTGCCCSRTRRITTRPRSSRSAARQPVIGGAIRDPLSGRAYVYQAMRVTGSGRPADRRSSRPCQGKLPQQQDRHHRGCDGYSSYGNQIGLATGHGRVRSITPGYVAKRMEIGAVIGAAPADKRCPRGRPQPGDVVILLGGTHRPRRLRRRDRFLQVAQRAVPCQTAARRCRRATPPEERKLQRLFRDPRS